MLGDAFERTYGNVCFRRIEDSESMAWYFLAIGKWGNKNEEYFADDGWSFSDKTHTTAEIIKNLYKAILDAAGDALILGCNTVSHLGAGLLHLSRIGDDTSG